MVMAQLTVSDDNSYFGPAMPHPANAGRAPRRAATTQSAQTHADRVIAFRYRPAASAIGCRLSHKVHPRKGTRGSHRTISLELLTAIGRLPPVRHPDQVCSG